MTHDWVIDRIHTLCDGVKSDPLHSVEDANALRNEFSEWLDPSIPDHDIYSLEYLSDK